MPKLASYHLHLPLLHVDTSRQMWLIYFLRLANELLIRLVVFYVPLFIFQYGEDIAIPMGGALSRIQKGVILVAAYFLVYRVATIVTLFPISRMITRFGMKTSLLASQVVEVLFLLSLVGVRQYPALLIASAIFLGLKVPLFWLPYNTMMSRVIFKRHSGEDISLLQILVQLVSVVTPALGGIIAVVLGYEALFLIGVVVALLIVFIIVELKDYHPAGFPSWSEFREWMSERRYQLFSLSVVGKYVNDVMIMLWPLYVFLLVDSVEKVGFLQSLSLFLAMVITLITGMFIDRARSQKPFYVSGAMLSIAWLARIGVATAFRVILVDTVDKLIASFHWLVYEVALLKRSIGGTAFAYYCYREVVMSLFAIVWWAFVIGLFWFTSDWRVLFVLAAAGVSVSMYVRERSGSLE